METTTVPQSVGAPNGASTSAEATSSYAANLDRLLGYYRKRTLGPNDISIAQFLFCAALARHRFVPTTGRMMNERVHAMVFGGAGAGKSSVVNALAGTNLAQVNAQAGYTRHPTVIFFEPSQAPESLWPPRLGEMQRADDAAAANTDKDCFTWKPLDAPADLDFWKRHVIWDCPDLTTQHAVHYEGRAIEIAALADVCIYVASDERYNDELPTNFLQGVLDAGKPVVVALTKVFVSDAEELVRLFREQVMTRVNGRELILDVIAIPAPTSGKSSDLWQPDSPGGVRLRATVARSFTNVADAKEKSRANAVKFLRGMHQKLLDPLRLDLAEWKTWIELVRKSANDTVLRYDREFLAGTHAAELQQARAEVFKSFDAPTVLQPVHRGLEFVREPYRMARAFIEKLAPRFVPPVPDRDVWLEKARKALLESLRIACSVRKTRHPVWEKLHAAFGGDIERAVEDAGHKTASRQNLETTQRIQGLSRKIKNSIGSTGPIVWSLQIVRALLDIAAVAASYRLCGFTWYLLPVGLLALGAVDELVKLGVNAYVNRQRDDIIAHHKDQIRELVRVSCIDELLKLPPGLGPELFELNALEEALNRQVAALR